MGLALELNCMRPVEHTQRSLRSMRHAVQTHAASELATCSCHVSGSRQLSVCLRRQVCRVSISGPVCVLMQHDDSIVRTVALGMAALPMT
jgi:hypothetical protein